MYPIVVGFSIIIFLLSLSFFYCSTRGNSLAICPNSLHVNNFTPPYWVPSLIFQGPPPHSLTSHLSVLGKMNSVSWVCIPLWAWLHMHVVGCIPKSWGRRPPHLCCSLKGCIWIPRGACYQCCWWIGNFLISESTFFITALFLESKHILSSPFYFSFFWVIPGSQKYPPWCSTTL